MNFARSHSLHRHFRRFLSRSALYATDPVIGDRSTLLLGTKDNVGALSKSLSTIAKKGINLTRIESKYGLNATEVQFVLDMELAPDNPKVQQILTELKKDNGVQFVRQLPPISVPWFPATNEEVDSLALLVLEGGVDLQNPDHPGFNDPEYRKRRHAIANTAANFKIGEKPAIVTYTEEETKAWGNIWRRLLPLLEKHACAEYLESFHALQRRCGYREDNIPQLREVSDFIHERTGFRLRPTAGLLSSRHFLNGLAFNTFFCTQYLRHSAQPFYTPEPDVVHELVGHAPLFANPEFARFSQEIGLASIGATDEQISELARCYWFSIEFGLCKAPNSNERKIYGSGILSSFGEMEYAISDKPEIREWDPFAAAKQEYPITTFQPLYYIAESFESAKHKLQEFAASLRKPFTAKWDNANEKLIVDGNIVRQDKESSLTKGTYGD